MARSELERRARLNATVHLHGPRRVGLSDTEVMAVLLVRNGEYFVRKYIEHHFALGVRHILVVDNGSTDATLDICRRYDRVTVLGNTMPAKEHECGLRGDLARSVSRGGWFLFADSDELVDLPLGGDGALAALTDYCNMRGYTAVVGQMLDRFSDRPYAALKDLDYEEAVSALTLYSLKDIETVPYSGSALLDFGWFLRGNVCEDPQIGFRIGGLRTEVFGENPFLSKHSLVRNRRRITPMSHPHCASGVSVADFTLVLHHYKLAGDWVQRDWLSVNEAIWDHGEDTQRLAAIEESGFRITAAEPRHWQGIAALQDEGFLYASRAFRTLAAGR